MIFTRIKETEFLEWKKDKSKKPLILKGARQVGKTSFLKTMGEKYFKAVAYFNFEEQVELKELFEQTKSIKRLLASLSLLCGFKIEKGKTLIFFDEIQECPEALNSLKYFQEDSSEHAVVAAGSLLGVALSSKGFPVGKVTFMNFYALTFEEYLKNTNKELYKIYLEFIPKKEIVKIPDIFYTQLMEYYKIYFISGGMPEAAAEMHTSNDITKVNKILTNILGSTQMDFRKHTDEKTAIKIGYIWNSLPSQLARENKKFLYQIVKEGARAREYEDALLWLLNAGIITKIQRVTKPSIPLKAYADLNAYKLYIHDIGLLRELAELKPEYLLYKNNLFTEFKGSLAENYVAQSLITNFEIAPFYWSSEGIAEIDFIIEYNKNLIPIEVKADENIRSKSLAYYQNTFSPKIRLRFSSKNISLKDNVINIPFFYVDKVKNFLTAFKTQ